MHWPENPAPRITFDSEGCLPRKGCPSGVLCVKRSSKQLTARWTVIYTMLPQTPTVHRQRSTMLGLSSIPLKCFWINAATSGMLGNPGSTSLLSGSTVGPVADRHIYRDGMEVYLGRYIAHTTWLYNYWCMYLHQTRVLICWMAKVITALISIVAKCR